METIISTISFFSGIKYVSPTFTMATILDQAKVRIPRSDIDKLKWGYFPGYT